MNKFHEILGDESVNAPTKASDYNKYKQNLLKHMGYTAIIVLGPNSSQCVIIKDQ